jgi:hypothetical protein
MERVMDTQRQEQFVVANRELCLFLQRVDGLAHGTESVTEEDMLSLSRRLSTITPQVGDILASQANDEGQPNEIAEYIKNLRALQTALETVRVIMLAQKVHLDGARRHLQGLQGWVNAYQQTT